MASDWNLGDFWASCSDPTIAAESKICYWYIRIFFEAIYFDFHEYIKIVYAVRAVKIRYICDKYAAK